MEALRGVGLLFAMHKVKHSQSAVPWEKPRRTHPFGYVLPGACVRCAGASFPRSTLSAINKVKWSPNERSHINKPGAPIQDVANMLGHKDLPMLAKHHRHRRGVVDLTEGQSRIFEVR